ncbi:MAG: VTT domain-containing protein [Burkholderiaceae bacterium]
MLLAFILVPFFLLEDEVSGWVQASLDASLPTQRSLALVTLAVVAFLLADIVLPILASFVLATTGYLLGTLMGTAIGFIGLSCASLAGYGLGRYAGAPLAQHIVGRTELERFAALSQRHGDVVLVGFRAMPVLSEATTILAGASRMPLARFMLVVSLGNSVVALLYAGIGAVSASQSSFLFASMAAIVVPVLIVIVVRRTVPCAARSTDRIARTDVQP